MRSKTQAAKSSHDLIFRNVEATFELNETSKNHQGAE